MHGRFWYQKPVVISLRICFPIISSHLTREHRRLRDCVFPSLQAAYMAPWFEVGFNETREESGDVPLPAWTHRKPPAFDATMVFPLTREWLAKAQRGQPVPVGAAALAAEQRESQRHADHYRALGKDFIPLAVDTLGVRLRRVYESSGLSPDDGQRGQGRTLEKSRFTSSRPSPSSFSVGTLTS